MCVDSGGEVLKGVGQGGQVGVSQCLTCIEFLTDDVEQTADYEGGLVAGERFVAAEGAIGEADDDSEVSDAVDCAASPVVLRDVRERGLCEGAANGDSCQKCN